jgi:hypothetical protein
MAAGVAKAKKKMGRKKKLASEPGEPPPAVYGVRMSRNYLDWLDRLSKKERCGKADVIDRALAKYAELVGFEPPPER